MQLDDDIDKKTNEADLETRRVAPSREVTQVTPIRDVEIKETTPVSSKFRSST